MYVFLESKGSFMMRPLIVMFNLLTTSLCTAAIHLLDSCSNFTSLQNVLFLFYLLFLFLMQPMSCISSVIILLSQEYTRHKIFLSSFHNNFQTSLTKKCPAFTLNAISCGHYFLDSCVGDIN